jgi:hypothetical protein
MICYHTTDAETILANGFGDSFMFVDALAVTGVRLADHPLDCNEGANGDQVLRVEFPGDINLDVFEVTGAGKPYREWMVPAALINGRATVTLLNEDEESGIIRTTTGASDEP